MTDFFSIRGRQEGRGREWIGLQPTVQSTPSPWPKSVHESTGAALLLRAVTQYTYIGYQKMLHLGFFSQTRHVGTHGTPGGGAAFQVDGLRDSYRYSLPYGGSTCRDQKRHDT